MRDHESLNADEERFWRAFARVILVTTRALEADLASDSGLSLAEYGILMNLSEADEQRMTMSELARRVSLSASHIGRVVAGLAREGLVTRSPGEDDRRMQVATLTSEGLQRLEGAWPGHLHSARHRVLDHVDESQLPALATVMERLLEAADDQ